MKITTRADGRLQASVVVMLPNRKKKRIYVYGHTKQEINKKIAQIKTDEMTGRTFETVANEWWEMHADTLAPNSLKNYGPAVKRVITQFGAYPIKDITPAQISAWIKQLATGFADKTVRTHLMVVNLVMTYAVNVGDLVYNPAQTVKVPRNLPKNKVTSPETWQIDLIMENVADPFGLFYLFALTTGLRRGELLALRWSDIHHGLIRVNKSLCWQYNKPIIKGTKTAAGERLVPVPDILAPYLKRTTGLVFPGRGGGYMSEGSFQNQIKQYRKRTGVTCTIHQLRHAYATKLWENGVDPKDAQQILGHAQFSTTMDIYTDISKEKQQKTFDEIRKINYR